MANKFFFLFASIIFRACHFFLWQESQNTAWVRCTNKGFGSTETHVGSDQCLLLPKALNVTWAFKMKSWVSSSMFGPVLFRRVTRVDSSCLCFFPAAPPDYSSVVTEEEAEQRHNAVASQQAEDLSGILERPLMAFVQEFRFRPPPMYSEVSHHWLEATPVVYCDWAAHIKAYI